jgi:hypothetical protein
MTSSSLPGEDKLSFQSHNVLNITSSGDVSSTGSLSFNNGKFSVVDGVLTTQHLNVENSLAVHGSAVIEDSLTIGSGFALTPEGMTIDTSKHTGPLLELRSSQQDFSGSFLEINALTPGGRRGHGGPTSINTTSSMIRTAVDGITTFDLKTNGHLTVQGLQMQSGGVVVNSGGIQVLAGGMTVHGGLTLESGQLNLQNNELKLSNLILDSSQTTSHILQIVNSNPHFVGPVISFVDSSSGSGSGSGDGKYLILETKTGGAQSSPSFQLDSHGNVMSAGSVTIGKKLDVQKALHVGGILSFAPYQITAGDEIIIPSDSAFVEVVSDHRESLNHVLLPTQTTATRSLTPGQMLILRNLDETPLYLSTSPVSSSSSSPKKKLKLQSDVTIFLLFNGHEWIDIQSLSSSIDKVTNLQELTLQNDVDVGNFTITTGGYRMHGLNKGEVLVGSVGGTIKGRKGLTYSNGILSTQGLKAETLESDIEGKKKTIS